MNFSNKEFAVASIAGCRGVRYVFDGSDRDRPDASQLRTFDDAVEEARRWCGIADTVGGDAIIVHVPTWQLVHWYGPNKGKISGPLTIHARGEV